MSVIVRGMEMPKNCRECPVALSGKYCRITHTTLKLPMLPIRPNYCPLVALPDKHGRLVDLDALIRDHFSPEHRIALSEANKAWMRRIINEAPTIVESEGET